MTPERLKARRQIIQAANQYSIGLQMKIPGERMLVSRYGSRQIQRAVSVCRRQQLVKPAVLVAAGYRGVMDAATSEAIAQQLLEAERAYGLSLESLEQARQAGDVKGAQAALRSLHQRVNHWCRLVKASEQ